MGGAATQTKAWDHYNPIPNPSPFKGKGGCAAVGKGLAASDWMNEERVSQQVREGLIERARQMRKEPTNTEAKLVEKEFGGCSLRLRP